MADKKYHALFVLKDTHHRVASNAKLVGMTIDEYLRELLKRDGKNNEKGN